MLRRAVRARPVAIVGAIALLAALIPGAASAARLVGGHEQVTILRAFAHTRDGKPAVATSVRAATAMPSWVVVRWVTPTTGAETRPPAPTLHSSFFHVGGGHVTVGTPPVAARRDLQAPLSVGVLYSGSGSETINYSQTTRSICTGNGSYVDSESDIVTPMAWTVRYIVDLDHLQAAVRAGGSSAVLPTVSFERAGSALSATEHVSRSSVDQGCFGSTRTIRCTTSYYLRVPGAPAQLGLGPAGLQIAIPEATGKRGDCVPDDYPLGPSLWAGGGATAGVGALSLTGGRLPANPYAPISVRYPLGSAGAQQGYLTSPCQGITASCTDTMRWSGTVRLTALGH